ncbi:MAG: S41 family peptidase [Candidatus Neomarinimicrobiota bacterium]|nr:S41 family peptidase [Candidatus Neomarinimicrobiota bacterium]
MKLNRRFSKRYSAIFISLFFVSIFSFAFTKSDVYRELARSQRLINEVYKSLITRYADRLDTEKFTKIVINNILDDLDPYTVYMEEDEKESLDLLTKGKYGGVGINLGVREKKLTVISPMDNSPAKRKGIIAGDIIVKIDGLLTKEMSLDDAAKQIRGPKGTDVILSIKRFGDEKLIDFTLTRDYITVKDVAYTGMLNDETGYIRLTRFSKNSGPEMRSAIKNLQTENASRIIIDLRDNPGGLLQSAIEILDMITPKGSTLLSTKGRLPESNKNYISRKEPMLDEDIKIAILINEGSASASEIIAGAVQDLDRGVVVGTRSFGKGLVQSVYGLDGSGKRNLKVTTAKYYIPSGRLIQKPGYIDDEVIVNDGKEDSLFYTIGGRKVKGGGGISPDYEVEMPKATPLVLECWRKGLFFNFAQERQHRYDSYEDALADVTILDDFKSYIDTQDVDVNTEGEKDLEKAREKILSLDSTNIDLTHAFDFLETFIIDHEAILFDEEVDLLKRRLFLELIGIMEGSEYRVKESIKDDPVVMKAKEILQDPIAYTSSFIPDQETETISN